MASWLDGALAARRDRVRSRLKPVEVSFTPVDNQRLANLCGVLDENLRQIESALDVTIEAQILALLDELRSRRNLAMLLVSHNLGIVDRLCDTVSVLYAGRLVESGTTDEVLRHPRHPYTKALFQSIPVIFEERGSGRGTKLPVILGDSARSSLPRSGCPFEPRCTERMSVCREREPALVNLSASHVVSCFKYES